MARIVIAGASEADRGRLSRLLTAGGFTVLRCCASGGELRRALSACGGCAVVLLGAVPDGRPDVLRADFGDSVRILWIARPELLEPCEDPTVYRLPLPVSGQAVIAALERLTARPPTRTAAENRLVEQAKALLIRRHAMTEPEAHHALQQYAMRRGMKLAEYAAILLKTAETKEDS